MPRIGASPLIIIATVDAQTQFLSRDANASDIPHQCDDFGCTHNSDCTLGSNVIALCGTVAHCDFQWGISGKCQIGQAEAALESSVQQTCDYFGCTHHSDCTTGDNVIAACGSVAHCDFQWGISGKCQIGPAEAVVEYDAVALNVNNTLESSGLPQKCDDLGCLHHSDCTMGDNVIALCGNVAHCDFQWKISGKCQIGPAEAAVEYDAHNNDNNTLESSGLPQKCDDFGCTHHSDCTMGDNVIALCGNVAHCDFQWGISGKCQIGLAEDAVAQTVNNTLESSGLPQKCDDFGCTHHSDCTMGDNVIALCGTVAHCDFQWGISGKCQIGLVEDAVATVNNTLESSGLPQKCDDFGCTHHSDCTMGDNVIALCGTVAHCDFQWGISGKCQIGLAEDDAVAQAVNNTLESSGLPQKCDDFGCTHHSDCTMGDNVIALCGTVAHCDFQWGISGKCQIGLAEDAVAIVNNTLESGGLPQKCDDFGCTHHSDCTMGDNVIALCGTVAHCDFQWGISGKCQIGLAEDDAVAQDANNTLESSGLPQKCDDFGCTHHSDCTMGDNVIALCGTVAHCDFQWGISGKCQIGLTEDAVAQTVNTTLESSGLPQKCDDFGCTHHSDCTMGDNVIALCGTIAHCDFQWGISGKCQRDAVEVTV